MVIIISMEQILLGIRKIFEERIFQFLAIDSVLFALAPKPESNVIRVSGEEQKSWQEAEGKRLGVAKLPELQRDRSPSKKQAPR
jgi:hypothetical protein